MNLAHLITQVRDARHNDDRLPVGVACGCVVGKGKHFQDFLAIKVDRSRCAFHGSTELPVIEEVYEVFSNGAVRRIGSGYAPAVIAQELARRTRRRAVA